MTEPDHRSVNLRRRSFAGQALEGTDFTAADLRGADLSNARLAGASFRDARLGVPPSTAALVLLAAVTVSVAAGVIAAQSIQALRDRIFGPHWEETLGGIEIVVVLVVFVGVMFWKGFDAAVKAFLVVTVVAVVTNLIARVIWGRGDLAAGARGIGLTLLRLTQRTVRRWGTRFVDADLTGADFTGTRADFCDMSGAGIHGVDWEPGHEPVAHDHR